MACSVHADAVEAIAPCSRCGRAFCPDCLVDLMERRYCAACKDEQVRDVLSGVDATRLEIASLDRRLVALGLDGMLLLAPFLGLLVATNRLVRPALGSVADWMPLASAVSLLVLYEGLLLSRWRTTAGKRAMEIRVVTPEGRPLRPRQAWTRALARGILGPLVLVDYLPALVTRERVCLHDLIARTRVVRWRA